MNKIIAFIYARAVTEQYHEFAINNLDGLKWIDRDELRFFLADNIPREVMSIHDIRVAVESYQPFIVDIENGEWYMLEDEYTNADITNIRSERRDVGKELSTFDKVMNKIKSYKLEIK